MTSIAATAREMRTPILRPRLHRIQYMIHGMKETRMKIIPGTLDMAAAPVAFD